MATKAPVRPRTPAPLPRARRRIRRAVVIVLATGVVAVFGAIAFLAWAESRIERIPASELPSLSAVTDAPRNILIVGSDSRASVPEEFDDVFGSFAGARTDVIMLVHLAPGEGAQLLSLPRDLKVDIPGHGTNRINAAYVFGGPDLLIRTIQNSTGITVNHFVEIDFGGFAAVVDAIGGVTMEFEFPARDLTSGLALQAGRQKLDSEQALAYVRSRKYQEFRDGEWITIGGSDIGRTHRQQRLLFAIFSAATAPSNALHLPSLALTVASEIRADEGLTPAVLLELGEAAFDLSASAIEMATLPVQVANEDGRSYVVRIEPEATNMIQAFQVAEPLSG